MAFVQKLPRQVTMTEGCYGSRLNLRYYPDSNSCDGTYSPAVEAGKIDIETPTNGPGHAVIWAQMSDGRDDGEAVLKGEWSHVIGGLKQRGPFEMRMDEVTGSAEGWWSLPGHQERNPWSWHPGETDTLLTNATKFGQRYRLRSSLSSRLDRNKSFFDELLEDEQRAVNIARYGVICAWIFLFQTAVALGMACWKGLGVSVAILQCTFQAVYSVTYFSFLVIYSRMSTLPPLDYVLGVLLYTLGYVCFLLLYVLGFLLADKEELVPVTDWLYVGGSILFLTGSICLVCATVPPAAPMMHRAPTWLEHGLRFSLSDQNAALFWGSMAFLVGSMFFSLDSIWTVVHPASKPATLGFWCAVLGYAFFTPGRVYFLWGSTTADCDAFLRGAEETGCFPNVLTCIRQGTAAVAPDDCSKSERSGCLACGDMGCGMCRRSSFSKRNIDAKQKQFPGLSSHSQEDMHGSMDAAKASLSLLPASPPVATAPAPLLPPPPLPLHFDEVSQQNSAPEVSMLAQAAPASPPFPHRLAPIPFSPSLTIECSACGGLGCSLCKCPSMTQPEAGASKIRRSRTTTM